MVFSSQRGVRNSGNPGAAFVGILAVVLGGLGAWRASSHWPRSLEDWLGGIYASMGTREKPGQRGRIQHPFAESMGHAHQTIGGTQRRLTGLWRNGSASDSRSEGWEFESLWPHLPHAGRNWLHNGQVTAASNMMHARRGGRSEILLAQAARA